MTQSGRTAMESCYERWNVKINEDKSQAIYFSYQRTPVVASLILKERQIPFVNHVKYLGVIIDKMLHVNYIEKRKPPMPYTYILTFTRS